MLMYLDGPEAALARLAEQVAPGGLLSILAKNRRAIGVREALTGDYGGARRLIESAADRSTGNLGLETRADVAEDLDRLAAGHGLTPLAWQGVRIFHDHLDDSWTPGRAAYEAAADGAFSLYAALLAETVPCLVPAALRWAPVRRLTTMPATARHSRKDNPHVP
ncbi:hypothetical protein ABTX77_40705 [Streptomyces sp. NPDC097704]|uniref:hypothetical protein n=1 Tax=Streptomyces sp. NPDC097704 TaxID=3157101 RepID=UPI00331FB354